MVQYSKVHYHTQRKAQCSATWNFSHRSKPGAAAAATTAPAEAVAAAAYNGLMCLKSGHNQSNGQGAMCCVLIAMCCPLCVTTTTLLLYPTECTLTTGDPSISLPPTLPSASHLVDNGVDVDLVVATSEGGSALGQRVKRAPAASRPCRRPPSMLWHRGSNSIPSRWSLYQHSRRSYVLRPIVLSPYVLSS